MITHPNCKINLGLHVVGKRPDGYHDLETIFIPVHDFCDELEITPATTNSPFPTIIQEGIALDNNPDDNLCMKAWQLLNNAFSIPPVQMRLKKNIPFGAGLGGGSSDAAFTIKMLNEMFSLNLTAEAMESYAARIGADCPFFIGNQAAYATGIGDELTPVDFDFQKLGLKVVVELPEGEHVSTREAYANIRIKDRKSREFILLTCYDLTKMSGKSEAYEFLYNIANEMGYNKERFHQLIDQYSERTVNRRINKE